MLTECHRGGSFKLSSGGIARDYYDLAPLFLCPDGLRTSGRAVVGALCREEFDALGCLELCPVPLIGAILSRTFTDKRGFIVRKKRKGHGMNNLIEGDLRPGDRVAILEDVISTGESVMYAVHIVEELGCRVDVILAIINRQEGCGELLRDYNFRWLFTRKELEDGHGGCESP